MSDINSLPLLKMKKLTEKISFAIDDETLSMYRHLKMLGYDVSEIARQSLKARLLEITESLNPPDEAS